MASSQGKEVKVDLVAVYHTEENSRPKAQTKQTKIQKMAGIAGWLGLSRWEEQKS